MLSKERDDYFQYRLACGHLRLISRKKIEIVEGETSVYCRKCDSFVTVKQKDGRWG